MIGVTSAEPIKLPVWLRVDGAAVGGFRPFGDGRLTGVSAGAVTGGVFGGETGVGGGDFFLKKLNIDFAY